MGCKRLWFLVLLAGIGNLPFYKAVFGAEECQIPNIPFWIGASSNEVFDEELLSKIEQCASLVVLNSKYTNEDKKKYKDIIRELHRRRPALPILTYIWASRWYQSDRVGSVTLKSLSSIKEYIIKDSLGRYIRKRASDGKAFVIANPVSKHYRKWVIGKIKNLIEDVNASGIALDVALRKPWMLDTCKLLILESCEAHATGMDLLFKELREAIGDKIIIYNGLYSYSDELLKQQARLLEYADGVAVEYFGLKPTAVKSDFEKDFLGYFRVIKRYPNKIFLIFGRPSWAWKDQNHLMRWAQYVYAAYLMVRNDNTYFKFHSSFQIPSHAGSAGGDFVLKEQKIDIGFPVTYEYQVKGCLFYRNFVKGIAAIYRHDCDGHGELKLNTPMISISDDNIYREKIILRSGDSAILLYVN